jgi:hypothetical protein
VWPSNPKQKRFVASRVLNKQYYIQTLNWNRVIDSLRGGELGAMTAYLIETMTDQENDTIADDDNLTREVAVNGPNKEGYWQACVKEIETLTRPAKMPGKLSQERNG